MGLSDALGKKQEEKVDRLALHELMDRIGNLAAYTQAAWELRGRKAPSGSPESQPRPEQPGRKPPVSEKDKRPVALWPKFVAHQKTNGKRATMKLCREWLRQNHTILLDDKFHNWWNNSYRRSQRRASGNRLWFNSSDSPDSPDN